MKFSDVLDEYLTLREKGPTEFKDHNSEAYHRRQEYFHRMQILTNALDTLVSGEVL